MQFKLRERFGLPFVFLLIAFASYFYVTRDLKSHEVLRQLSLLTWISLIPYGDVPSIFIASLPAPWPLLIEGILFFVIWVAIFMVFRGGYYSFRYAGDLSMWQLFGFCIVLGIAVFFFLMIPVLRQIEIWKESW